MTFCCLMVGHGPVLAQSTASTTARLADELARDGERTAARRELLRCRLEQSAHPSRDDEHAAASRRPGDPDGGANACDDVSRPSPSAEPADAPVRVWLQPAVWATRFYRRQIRPAVGTRCRLRPTCSEYFLQAVRRHGGLAVPLLADRLVREFGITWSGEGCIGEDDDAFYPDPLEAHAGWWRDRD